MKRGRQNTEVRKSRIKQRETVPVVVLIYSLHIIITMANKTVDKIKQAIVRGFASGIDLSTPNRFKLAHHQYGKEALANDFNRIGNDIRASMNAVNQDSKPRAY